MLSPIRSSALFSSFFKTQEHVNPMTSAYLRSDFYCEVAIRDVPFNSPGEEAALEAELEATAEPGPRVQLGLDVTSSWSTASGARLLKAGRDAVVGLNNTFFLPAGPPPPWERPIQREFLLFTILLFYSILFILFYSLSFRRIKPSYQTQKYNQGIIKLFCFH